MKIRLTESQLMQLTELQWKEKALGHIDNNRIPLTEKISKILYGNTRINVFHVSDIFHIDTMKNLIGTKKTISSFRFMTASSLRDIDGVQTKGGIIYQINGRLNLFSGSDIMSRPDENGIRWVDEYWIFRDDIRDSWIHISRELKKDFTFNQFDYFNLNELDPKKRNEYIKKYFLAIEKFIEENKDRILQYLHYRYVDSRSWDEILVSDIKINDILWSDHVASATYEKIKYKLRQQNDGYYNQGLSSREEYILNNYPEWVENIHKKLESVPRSGKIYGPDVAPEDIFDFVRDRGGYVDAGQYQFPNEIQVFDP